MKKIFITFLFFCLALFTKGQPTPESLFAQYHSAKTFNDKADILTNYFNTEAKGTFDERIASVKKTQDYFIARGDLWATGYIQLSIANTYRKMGQYSNSLKYSLPALKNFENGNDTDAILNTLLQIGSSFTESQNIQQGANYYKKCIPFIDTVNNKEHYARVLDNLADCYNKMHLPDSARPLLLQAINIASEQNDTLNLVNYYYRIGETHLAAHQSEMAKYYFYKSIDWAGTHTTDSYLAHIYNDLAAAFFTVSNYDTALFYAKYAVIDAYPEYKKELMTAYQWLYKSYEQLNISDSLHKYYRQSMDIKDSLFTSEKNSNIILMDFQEQTRQEEIAAKKIKVAAERRENIEYALISLGIVVGVGLFLLLSRRFVMHIKVIKAFGVITLLIVFEFFNLLLHPLLEFITHHSVFGMLASLVILAAALAPLHHKAEKWATAKLLEKNNEVRLAAGQKNN